MCVETQRLMSVMGPFLDAAEGGKSIETSNLIRFDRRNFTQEIYHRNYTGHPTGIQLILQAKFWLEISKILENKLTTQTLLDLHV